MKSKHVELIDRSIYMRARTIYALSSYREILYVIGPWGASILSILLVPIFCKLNPYILITFTSAGIFGLLGISWGLLASHGLISLGHGFYIGLAGYAVAFFNVKILQLPLWLSIILGVIISVLVSVCLHTSCLKLKKVYFLLVTFILPLVLTQVSYLFPGIFGGEQGISGVSTISYGKVPEAIGNYYLIHLILFITLIFCRRLVSGSTATGIILRGIGDNEYAVDASGTSVWRWKSFLFAVSIAIGSIAGALQVITTGYIGPSSYPLTVSLYPLIGGFLGGISSSMVGPMLGTYLLVLLLEVLRVASGYKIMLFGVIIIMVITLRPKGIWHYMEQFYHFYKRVL